MCVCVCVRAHARMCMCAYMCVCVCERERERERERAGMDAFICICTGESPTSSTFNCTECHKTLYELYDTGSHYNSIIFLQPVPSIDNMNM